VANGDATRVSSSNLEGDERRCGTVRVSAVHIGRVYGLTLRTNDIILARIGVVDVPKPPFRA